MLAASPSLSLCVCVCAGGLSPTVPSSELTLPQQRLDLPPLGLQARRLRGRTAAVGRHDANQSLINVGTVADMNWIQETKAASRPPLRAVFAEIGSGSDSGDDDFRRQPRPSCASLTTRYKEETENSWWHMDHIRQVREPCWVYTRCRFIQSIYKNGTNIMIFEEKNQICADKCTGACKPLTDLSADMLVQNNWLFGFCSVYSCMINVNYNSSWIWIRTHYTFIRGLFWRTTSGPVCLYTMYMLYDLLYVQQYSTRKLICLSYKINLF